MPNEPILLPLTQIVRVEEVLAATRAKRVLVADCYIAGVEAWAPKPWGWETGVGDGCTIINVDHHANDERFFRHVSSGNLAIEYLKVHGIADAETAVVINHTDCDSVISSALLCGRIDPEERYGDAVIAADHTGAPNQIADLLQALDTFRNFALSLDNLAKLERGEDLTGLVEARHTERALAKSLVQSGAFERMGRVVVGTLKLEQRVPGELLTSLFPDAWAIVSGTPMPKNNAMWEIKIRLGLAAPAGMSLFRMGVLEAEPKFGGRWNAGSTKRGGGSPSTPREVAERLGSLIQSL